MRGIDADALIAWTDNYYDSEKFTVGHFTNMVKDMPTIEERKTGKWIYHKDWDDDGECGYECSECGMGSEVNYNYCMRCGAKMEDGEQG